MVEGAQPVTKIIDMRTRLSAAKRNRDGRAERLSYAAVVRWMRNGLDTSDIARMVRINEADVWNVLQRGDG